MMQADGGRRGSGQAGQAAGFPYGRAPQGGDEGSILRILGLSEAELPVPVVVIVVLAGLIALFIFFSCSLGAVPPLEYGIRYNTFNKYADVATIYTSGRYLIFPWSKFLLFPASAQSIEFTNEARLKPSGLRYPALHTRTKEGLALHMQVSLQYELVGHQVGHLYQEFNTTYEDMFISTIRDALIKAAADYEAPQLWAHRAEVGQMMQKSVGDALQRTYATCWGLQLMVIELPVAYEDSIVQTQVQNQKIATRKFEQVATQTRAETKVIQSEYERRVKVIKANGTANYTVITRRAKANASRYTLAAEASVLDGVKDRLNLTSTELVEYQRLTAVQMQPNASIYYGFADGAQVMMQASEERGGPSHSSSTADSLLKQFSSGDSVSGKSPAPSSTSSGHSSSNSGARHSEL